MKFNIQIFTLILMLQVNLIASDNNEFKELSYAEVMEDAKKFDSDKDGINNYEDNCPAIKNSQQKDRDHDNVGDVCDKCPDIPAKGMMNGCPSDPSIDPDNIYSPNYRMRVKKHKGNYFSIDYPEDFQVVTPYTKDEAYFISEDKGVTYFVYSPLWGGEPTEYLKMKNNEKRISQKTLKGKNTNPLHDINRDIQITKWVSYTAKDGSYTRSYVHIKRKSSDEILKMSDIDLVFGFQYQNKTAYNIYVNDYKIFKKSLLQFAD